jgi:predicted metalloenzyme YecM
MIVDMNAFDQLSRDFQSAEIRCDDAPPGSPAWDLATSDLDHVALRLEAATASRVGREAAIDAGHRTLARVVTAG